MPKAEYDKQGKLFWHLAKKAGWSEERVNALLLSKWKATHWNALRACEKRAALNMMQAYAKKNDLERSRQLRQSIMALVSKNGHDVHWLHDRMAEWGYGDSMRLLCYADTYRVYELVRKALPGQRVPKVEEVEK